MIRAKPVFCEKEDWLIEIGPFEWYNRVSSSIRVVEQWKICREIIDDKIAFCEKTAGLRSGNFSDLNSACLKVLVPVKIFQIYDILYESERCRVITHGLYACTSWNKGLHNRNFTPWKVWGKCSFRLLSFK
jgi:hypothetical protein